MVQLTQIGLWFNWAVHMLKLTFIISSYLVWWKIQLQYGAYSMQLFINFMVLI